MSWLFSQALVEEYSAGTCSAGKPSAQLNVMPTPHPFWWRDKTIEPSDLSRFGLTCAVLTADHGAELLTWCQEDSPAKTSALPAGAKALQVSAQDFGWKWPASFAKFDLHTSSWKTRQASLLGDLELFSETWPAWGSMRDGECLAHTTPQLPTSEKESGFWPTIRASDGERGGRGDLIQAVRGNANGHFKMYPTPTASNTKANHMRGADKGKVREPRSYGARGPLNPTWIEWLMGWPSKWTEFEPLETAKFREWQRQHGDCSAVQPESETT